MTQRHQGMSDWKGRGVMSLCLCCQIILAVGCAVQGATPLERAERAREQQDYGAAASFYEEYLASAEAGPAAENALFQLAEISYLKLKDLERARAAYQAFLERHSGSERAYDAKVRLAEVFVALESPREAIALYEEAAAARPGAPEARQIRVAVADLYYDSNNFSQAELEYARAVEGATYDDISERSLLRMASINHMVRDDAEAAVPIYERVAASTADPVVRRQALYSISECYADLFRFDEAIATLERIDDPAEAGYVAGRTAELERQKRALQDAPPEVDWSKTKGGTE